jgi:tetratricopeptide (TPR) repeat protein
MRTGAHRAAEALPLLRRAAELEKKSAEPYDALAECYRSLHNWPAAVSAANTAIDSDAADAEAYYQRACALARLGRIRDAIASLQKSVELDQIMAESIEDEQDLKPLASLPEFKKLLADRDKQ